MSRQVGFKTKQTQELIEAGYTHIKYNNRKIYSVLNARYENVSELYQQFKLGFLVKVFDYSTTNDVTSNVLASGFVLSGEKVKGVNCV